MRKACRSRITATSEAIRSAQENSLPAFIRGLNSAGVMSCAKHFPGQRNVDIDSHFELDVIPYSVDDMMNREWIPFKEAINAEVSMIMTLHAGFTAIDPTNTPATLSKPIVEGMLKGTLGYRGLVGVGRYPDEADQGQVRHRGRARKVHCRRRRRRDRFGRGERGECVYRERRAQGRAFRRNAS